jgi:hypothetical protein
MKEARQPIVELAKVPAVAPRGNADSSPVTATAIQVLRRLAGAASPTSAYMNGVTPAAEIPQASLAASI